MARANELLWLTVFFSITGVLFLFAVALTIYFVANYWLPLLLLGAAGCVAWWWYRSPGRLKAEREKEHALLFEQALYLSKQRNFPDPEAFAQDTVTAILGEEAKPHWNIACAMLLVTRDLYIAEEFAEIPEPPPIAQSIEGARWRDRIHAIIAKLSDPGSLDIFRSRITDSLSWFSATLPPAAQQSTEDFAASVDQWNTESPSKTFMLPLPGVLADTKKSVEELILPFYTEEAKPLFCGLRKQLDENLHALSGVPLSNKNSPQLVMPTNFSGDDPIYSYLKDTPLLKLFETSIPFVIPEKIRFEGHWIVAPPGRGKTTLLSTMFAEDIGRDASIIVMDSKGDLLEPIRRMKGIEDRLVILEPDANFPLALNPLDISKEAASLNPQERQLRMSRVISYLEQLFSGLFEAKMTPLQSRFFRVVLRAIITASPNPSLATLRTICQTGFEQHLALDKLEQEDRDFFLKEFKNQTYTDTRNQVLWRLGLLLDNPIFKAMFSAPNTKVDMGELMNSRKIVLINNSKAILDDDGSEFFGRFFLTLIRTAAQQRSRLKENEKVPVFFYIDECQSVIKRDQNIATIIDECRSQKIALIMAHQRIAQIDSGNVLDALSNCAIRMANSDHDADYLAEQLRTTPEFLRQPRGTFAAYVRDLTSTAISLQVPNVKLGDFDKITPQEYKAVQTRVRAQYCRTPEETKPPIPRPPVGNAPPPRPDDDTPTAPAKY